MTITKSQVGALGFTKLEVGAEEGSRLTLDNVCAAINAAAKDRNITLAFPNDAADLCRDIMVDEAVWSLGGRWDIIGDTLRVWPANFGDAWPFKEDKETT